MNKIIGLIFAFCLLLGVASQLYLFVGMWIWFNGILAGISLVAFFSWSSIILFPLSKSSRDTAQENSLEIIYQLGTKSKVFISFVNISFIILMVKTRYAVKFTGSKEFIESIKKWKGIGAFVPTKDAGAIITTSSKKKFEGWKLMGANAVKVP